MKNCTIGHIIFFFHGLSLIDHRAYSAIFGMTTESFENLNL
jgi:hypothetical protein